MPEILTESFCERCGTRYTFESSAPRSSRLRGVRVVTRGLKHFVMSDDTSLDEAMAAARSDVERDATSHQLEAFHKTFNFCMSCRQYTCGNCWNEAEGRCLTCAPNLGREILPAPFPMPIDVAPTGANGHLHEDEVAAAEELPLEEIDVAARLGSLAGEAEPEPAEAEPVVPEPEPIAGEDEVEPEPEPIAAEAEVEPEPEPIAAEAEVEPEPEPIAAEAEVEPEPEPIAAEPDALDDRVAAAKSRTSDFLGRFRPGQSLDDVLAEFERSQAAQDSHAAEDQEPAAAAAQQDAIEQPTWRITPEEAAVAPAPPPASQPAEPTPPPTPAWPSIPQWPTAPPAPTSGTILGRPVAATGGIEALWAASSRDVLGGPVPSGPGAAQVAPQLAVQPCVSCGLSLSATARFCRRCGTAQQAG
jgi:hypothetical protein